MIAFQKQTVAFREPSKDVTIAAVIVFCQITVHFFFCHRNMRTFPVNEIYEFEAAVPASESDIDDDNISSTNVLHESNEGTNRIELAEFFKVYQNENEKRFSLLEKSLVEMSTMRKNG